MYFYWLGLIQEFAVIINLYNGDLLYFINEDIEYSIIDIIILFLLSFHRRKVDFMDWFLNIICLFAHLQWYLHSPFSEWPEWWIGKKTENDIRHRTEYYDTHVMCFCIRLILVMTRYRKYYVL